MADLSSQLRRLTIARLGQRPSSEGGVRTWLSRGAFRPSEESTAGSLILEGVSLDEFIGYLGFDYERFAFASFETRKVAALESDHHNLLAWPLLKLYYSGFFSAHALMRVTGGGVSILEGQQVDELNEIVELMAGNNPNIRPGPVVYRLEQSLDRSLRVIIEPQSEGRGVHESFWRLFVKFLERLARESVERGDPDADEFFSDVDQVSRTLSGGQGNRGAWYSALRNEINYRHEHGVWFPPSKTNRDADLMREMGIVASKNLRLDFNAGKTPLQSLVAISNFLAALNVELADHVASLSSGANSFGKKWAKLKRAFEVDG